ncbi:NADH-quinone oxidoreductase subunit D [Peptococcus simiae]|uniref:NADH-quinone oxidoreductase subunit D n=1 Tax=Peptococcus simiae TaxID=1643805 RepID=A0ABW9H357_9FIRM
MKENLSMHDRAQLTEADQVEALRAQQNALRDVSQTHHPSEPFVFNLGPQHPSTHGVFRAHMHMDGEHVLAVDNVIGYLHRGIEKIAEQKTWAQFTPYTDRLDYLSPILNEWGYLMGVEKLMNLTIPERGEYVRVILGELQRVANHLVYLASFALDLNGYTAWMYMFREREKILDILEAYSGSRMNNHALRIGGAPTPLPEGMEGMITRWLDGFPAAMDDFANVVHGNEIFQARAKNVGIIDVDTCMKYSVGGANLRAAGKPADLRKDRPYSVYDRFDFKVITRENGDSFDRYMVRFYEMEESCKIIRQALDQMPKEGPTMAKVPKMIKVPKGEVYAQIEGSKGWLGYYIVSDGGMKPSRIRIHGPSVMSLFAIPAIVDGMLLQDYISTLASIDIVLGEVDR